MSCLHVYVMRALDGIATMSPSTDDVSLPLDPESISASVSVPDLCDNTACMVNVRWIDLDSSVSCGGSCLTMS